MVPEGDDRAERVAKDVAPRDAPFRDAPRPEGPCEVRRHLLEERGARDLDREGPRLGCEDDCRQDQVGEGPGAADLEPAQVHAHDEDQHSAEHEVRHGQDEARHGTNHPVEHRVPKIAASTPIGMPSWKASAKCCPGELGRVADRVREDRHDGEVVDK